MVVEQSPRHENGRLLARVSCCLDMTNLDPEDAAAMLRSMQDVAMRWRESHRVSAASAPRSQAKPMVTPLL